MISTEFARRGDSDERATGPRVVDFRRPSKFGREHVRSLEVAHEVFARRFGSALGHALRAMVQLEPISIDQVSYDDYTRSMPSPNLVGVVTLPGMPGGIVIDMSVQLALQLVDRMLGGPGLPLELRRPTEIEKYLLRDIVGHAVDAVGEALEPLLDESPELAAVEYNPQLVQIAAPSDMVLLLSYRITVAHGVQSEGLLTLCYPSATLGPVLSRLDAQGSGSALENDPEADSEARRAVLDQLREIDVALSVRLADSTVAASDLASLQLGDVLRLEHRVGAPVRGCVADTDVLEGHVGLRGRRLALQITEWLPNAAAAIPTVPVLVDPPQEH